MEYPIRVLHLVRYLEQGGIQNLLMNLYRHIDRNEVQFDFLVCGEGTFDDEVKELGGNIYKIGYITDLGKSKYEDALVKFFRQHSEYKIIHSHLNEVSGAVMEAAKKANVPVRIAHAHNTGNNNNIIQKIYKIYLKRKISKNATDLFACSEEAAKWLYGREYNKSVILNNAIDINRFDFSRTDRNEVRKKYNIADDCVLIGNVGRLLEEKNQLYLLEIFKYYHDKNPNSKLMLIGEGKYEKNIKIKIEELRLGKFVLIIKPTKEIEKYYSSFDYFIFPSKREGLGMVLIEAQVSGLKCFASDKVIPKTTKITKNIDFIDLKKGPQEWAKLIPTSNEYNREKVIIKDDNYDIRRITEEIQKFYLKEQYENE